MKCLNCNKEMQDKSYYSDFYGFAGWDVDYESCELHENHKCKSCGISFTEGKWIIPDKYPYATEKQVRMVHWINSVLDTHYEPILKYPTMKFISEHVDKANKASEESKGYAYDSYDDFDESDRWFDEPF